MTSPNRPTVKPQAGFSLLETLVAFTVLALSVGVLLRIFGGGAQMTGKADEHARAVTLAESLLVEKACEECELPPGETGGEFDEQFRWVMRVEPYQPEGDAWPDNLPVEPFWVQITLEWGETEQPQTFGLGTLRVRTKNRPGGSPMGPRSALPYDHG